LGVFKGQRKTAENLQDLFERERSVSSKKGSKIFVDRQRWEERTLTRNKNEIWPVHQKLEEKGGKLRRKRNMSTTQLALEEPKENSTSTAIPRITNLPERKREGKQLSKEKKRGASTLKTDR